MTKKSVKTQDETPEELVTEVKVTDFTEVPKKNELVVKLKPGEVLMAELDENGSETKTFVTNVHTAEKYFKDEKKFKLKKKD